MSENKDTPEAEEWRDVVGYEGHYQVSSLGRVRSLPRVVPYLGGTPRRLRGKMMALHPVGQWTHMVAKISFRGRDATLYVHRLVLEAFVGPCPPGMEACHFPDRDTRNNRLDNLRWGTHLENMDDRRKHGSLNGKMARVITPEIRAKMSASHRRRHALRKAG